MCLYLGLLLVQSTFFCLIQNLHLDRSPIC
uniref:Uncharacterized protein n=1 Tax=Rhizophora mucronata TaxID=61149 RepID=A0A2P2NSX6_RHIMU